MEVDQIIRAAEEQGWRVKRTKKGLLLYPPNLTRGPVAIHLTPSDRRAVKNFLAEMRRHGLVWPWPPMEGEG